MIISQQVKNLFHLLTCSKGSHDCCGIRLLPWCPLFSNSMLGLDWPNIVPHILITQLPPKFSLLLALFSKLWCLTYIGPVGSQNLWSNIRVWGIFGKCLFIDRDSVSYQWCVIFDKLICFWWNDPRVTMIGNVHYRCYQ